MALLNIIKPSSQVQNSQGAPLAGGSVYLYEPGTTNFITSYRDSGLVVPHATPVGLSSSGRANIWITRDCDMFVYDRNGNLVLQELNANPDALGEDQGGGLVPNGSFEIDTDVDTVPDGWTLASSAGSSNAIDTTQSTDGGQSFRFTSSGVGGGSLTTTDFFPVTDLENLNVNFDILGSILGPNNRVRVEWYDISFVSISNTDIYNATNTPTTWTEFQLSAVPPGGSRFAKLRLIGIDPSVPFSGSTWFDRINVFYPAVVSGVFDNITIQNNEIISTNINGAINLLPNGTGTLRLGTGVVTIPEFSADALSATATFQKSRNAVDGLHTVVQVGDALGTITFSGSDGAAFQPAAQIIATVLATPGASDMPGALSFWITNDGSATPIERIRIESSAGGQGTTLGINVSSSSAYVAPITYAGLKPSVAIQGGNVFLVIDRFNSVTAANPSTLALRRARGSPGSGTIVNAQDEIGVVEFAGFNGTTFDAAVKIVAIVDGTPGAAGDMPGALQFRNSADGAAGAATERMRLQQDGTFVITITGTYAAIPKPVIGVKPALTLQGAQNQTIQTIDHYTPDTNSGQFVFRKSRAGSVNTFTIAQSGDQLGRISFSGANGTDFDMAAEIRAEVDGTPGASNDMPGRLVFLTSVDASASLTEALRITNAGQLVSSAKGVAFGTPVTFSGVIPQILVQTGTAAGIASVRQSADTAGAFIFLGKSRSATYGGHTVVVSGDTVGVLNFRGDDGTGQIELASINAAVDGTPGTNDMPGRLVFSTTPDGQNAAIERVRITQDGLLYLTGNGATFAAATGTLFGSAIATVVTQITQTTSSLPLVGLRYSADANGAAIGVGKSRNATLGSHTVVQNGDNIGSFDFFGSGGTNWINGARIMAHVDGTPGAADMPTRLSFWTTPDGTATAVERLRIAQDGYVTYPSVDSGIIDLVRTTTGTRLNTTTLSDDTQLTCSITPATAAGRWAFECLLDFTNAAATADVKIDFNIPNDSYMYYATWQGSAGSTGSARLIAGGSSTLTTIAIAAAESVAVHVWGMANTGGSTGTFALQWAQNTLDAANSTDLSTGSWLRIRRLV